jgi:uncharacterized delta-60 repeat protein
VIDRFAIIVMTSIGLSHVQGVAHAAVGLDVTFGDAGRQTTVDVGGPQLTKHVATMADGRIVAAGDVNSSNQLTVARYLANGSLDQGFAQGGVFRFSTSQNVLLTVAELFVHSDGRIVLTGSISAGNQSDYWAMRLRADGSRDSSFGDRGFAQWDVAGGVDEAHGGVVDATGRILIVGRSGDFVTMIRALPTGKIDRQFGNRGRVITDIDDVTEAGLDATIANNRIYVAARTKNNIDVEGCRMLRYRWSGVLDIAFGGAGSVVVGDSDGMICQKLADDNDGGVVLFGQRRTGGGYIAARVLADGTPDARFSSDGIAPIVEQPAHGFVSLDAMAIAPDASLVFSGARGESNNKSANFLLVGLTSSGAHDNEFGPNGAQQIDFFSSADISRAVAVDAANRIVATGEVMLGDGKQGAFGLVRLVRGLPEFIPVVIEKELMITDPTVRNSAAATSPGGRWRFAHLVTAMAPQGHAKVFVKALLGSWKQAQLLNAFTAPARASIASRVIEPWKCADGQPGVSDAAWDINLENAPLRLSAIVYRPDISRRDMPGGPLIPTPEARLVFDVMARDGNCAITGRQSFTVILEYGLPLDANNSIESWATRWHALGTLDFGDEYNTALEAITQGFAGRGVAQGKPNGSALNQIRTNEIALDSPWELREFNIDAGNGLPVAVTVKQTPHDSINGSALLARYLTANEAHVTSGATLPERFEDAGIVGPNSLVSSAWVAGGIDPTLLRKFSVGTCSGCHQFDTNVGFIHIHGDGANGSTHLSPFVNDDLIVRREIMEALLAGNKDRKRREALLGERAGRVH